MYVEVQIQVLEQYNWLNGIYDKADSTPLHPCHKAFELYDH